MLLSACLLSAFIVVPPVRNGFDVVYWRAAGPGFVAAVEIDDAPRNITLFTEEGFNLMDEEESRHKRLDRQAVEVG